MTTATLSTNPRLIAGCYRTHTRIGQGRLGEIFAATDESFEDIGVERQVAIQVIPQSIIGNNKLFNKLNVAYTMLKTGAHPNIVAILQFGRDGQFGFLAMEYLEGASLRVLLERAETLPPGEVIPVIRGVGEALKHLHAKDIVHGNLTTRNVFVTEDLGVRLLDVVPLGSDAAIFRGATMSEPFGRATVEDDVFGLACLAYEMLSGKHPFNYSTPGEARLAGLEVERIASLTDGEWHALRLALSFEHEGRAYSLADFMRDFGIAGTERLRPTNEQPERYETGTYAAEEKSPPPPEEPIPVQNMGSAASGAAGNPIFWLDSDLPGTRSRRKGRHPLRTAILAMLLVGLVAWSYYGEPEEKAAELIAYIDATMELGLVEPSDGVIDVRTTEPATPIEAVLADAVKDSSEAEPAIIIEETVSTAEETIEESISTTEKSIDQPEPVEALIVETMTDTVDEATDEAADPVLTVKNTDAAQAEPDMIVVDPFVSVSERDAAARIPLQLNIKSTSQLTWWTSELTASADHDFISVQQRIMTAASLEGDNILHISLINDSVPEPIESFFVNLGLRNTEQGKIEHIATVRVDIIDDDLP